jgi:LemA protein
MSLVLILVGVAVLVVVYLFTTYNKFVTTKTRIQASIQEIGNQLKRQADLIPNLVESVKGYLKHEKDVFKMLTLARTQVMQALKGKLDPQKLVDVSAQLQSALQPIRVVLESNPQLQAAAPTQKLMDELRDTADKVMYARRTLIDLTADYNVMVMTVPSNLVAMLFGFTKEQGLKTPETGAHLELSGDEMQSPKVKLS